VQRRNRIQIAAESLFTFITWNDSLSPQSTARFEDREEKDRWEQVECAERETRWAFHATTSEGGLNGNIHQLVTGEILQLFTAHDSVLQFATPSIHPSTKK
jgi:hypothetical protein